MSQKLCTLVFADPTEIWYFFSLFQLCQQIHDTVLSTRDRLALELEKGQEEAERACKEQIEEITAIMVGRAR